MSASPRLALFHFRIFKHWPSALWLGILITVSSRRCQPTAASTAAAVFLPLPTRRPPCSLCLKGAEGEEAVLCSSSKTYAVKTVETTNLVLLVPGDDAADAAAATPPPPPQPTPPGQLVGLATQVQKVRPSCPELAETNWLMPRPCALAGLPPTLPLRLLPSLTAPCAERGGGGPGPPGGRRRGQQSPRAGARCTPSAPARPAPPGGWTLRLVVPTPKVTAFGSRCLLWAGVTRCAAVSVPLCPSCRSGSIALTVGARDAATQWTQTSSSSKRAAAAAAAVVAGQRGATPKRSCWRWCSAVPRSSRQPCATANRCA